ncbi:MAG: glycosyltransferase family 4 protein [Candidatus Bathyarchaeota archaeon]|nr:glycosyltransferase family 4 protein [Candidatus Bathyarchaeota archaeon]
MLKVCVISSYFPPRGYGGNAVYELCRQLARHGLQIHVIAAERNGECVDQQLTGIHIHRVPTHFLKLFQTEYPVSPLVLRRILKCILSDGMDLVHANFEIFQTTFASALAKRIAGKPMVLTMHGQGLTSKASYGTGALDFMWAVNHNTIERFAVRSADRIVALTETVRAKAIKLGANPSKISVIPNGVDTDRFKPSVPKRRYFVELDVTHEDKVVMFVGRLHPAHGIPLFLLAIPQVIKIHPKAIFVLVGGGPLKPFVLRFIESQNLQKHVRVLDYREDVPDLLSVANLFVYPALSVGMPLSVLEAMASGKAVIAFDIEGNREIITEKTGFLVHRISANGLAAKIVDVLSHLDITREMEEKARKHIESNFTWERVSTRIINIYRGLVFA